uniref:Uncharacterized protein n=1 Tax=Vannella robusta TaxID=1487602 RepID=A0A7S4HT13_9EUKA|mmetsp:Transcript_15353/g.19517  ORF Transcript_15353/g.19517 Transcript_15353/m.19517 type:complete len:320 (+) Transcript_15353:3-962(+)
MLGAASGRRWSRSLRRRRLVVGLVLVVCFMVAYWGLGGVGLFRDVDQRRPVDEQFIALTEEYQVFLVRLEDWENREQRIQEIMELFELHCSFFNPLSATVSTNIRYQYVVDLNGPSRCHSRHIIRVREYAVGPLAGTATVSIKWNDPNFQKTLGLPFWPADHYLSNATQKCEKDFHHCYSKYSRETRIRFSEQKQLHTCRDIVEIFPYAFDTLKVGELWNTVPHVSHQYYYIREYSGYMNTRTKYSASVSLRYDSLDDAQSNEVSPIQGEWSVRIYSLDNGASTQYDGEVANQVKTAQKQISTTFGDKTCSWSFLGLFQ